MAWLTGWENRIQLDIADTNIDSDLTNFPVLISLSSSAGAKNLDVTAIFDELTSDANRKKIAVTTSDGETQCYVEIERWDDANEVAWLWVKVPSILSSGGATLYLYYDSSQSDNSTYVGDTTDAAAQNVWDSNFVGVWHMAQDPNGDAANSIKDSTSNANHGTPSGTMTSADLVNAQIGKGIDFDGVDDAISCGSDSTLDDITTITCEFGINPDSWGEGTAGTILNKCLEDNTTGWRLYVLGGATEDHIRFLNYFDTPVISLWRTAQDSVTLGVNHFFALTYDNSSTSNDPVIYKNGASITVTEITAPTGTIVSDASQDLYIGSRNGVDRGFDGKIDEVRISNTIRNAAWLKATYYSNTDNLITFTADPLTPSEWSKSITLTIADTNIDSDLTNFPVLLHLSESCGAASSDATRVFDELGSDGNRKKIAVTTSDGETQCYVEIEQWDDANEEAWLWIKVPSILASGGATLYLYYDSTQVDNGLYVGDTGDGAAQLVWDSNFIGVWHMGQNPNGDPAGAILDSTANGYNGTPSGSMTTADWVDGLIGKAIDFDGSNDKITTTCPGISGTGDRTVEIVMYAAANADQGGMVFWGWTGTTDGTKWNVTYDVTGGAIRSEAQGGNMIGTTPLDDSVWRSITSIFSGTTTSDIIHYVNGELDAETSSVEIAVNTGSDYTVIFGYQRSGGADYYLPSILAEVRISNSVRNAAWVKATYYSNHDLLVTVDIGLKESATVTGGASSLYTGGAYTGFTGDPNQRHKYNTEKGYRLYVDDEPYENQLGIGSRKPAFTQNDAVYQQSQFKKPYWEDDYEEMEYLSDSFPGFPYDYDFDTPFIPGINNFGPDGGTNPWHVVCFCDTSGTCYGEGGFYCSSIRCSWPVTGVSIDSLPAGCSLKVSGGSICAKCAVGERGTISYHINMQAKFKHNGQTVTVQCAHYSQMSHCFDECSVGDMAWDYTNSIETIARNASGAVYITDTDKQESSAYSWSVSGTGFTLTNAITTDLTNTLNADGTACGSAEITVTGCDGTTVTGYVRCTTGSWGPNQADCNVCGGGSGISSCTLTIGNTRYTTHRDCICNNNENNCPQYCEGINWLLGQSCGSSSFPCHCGTVYPPYTGTFRIRLSYYQIWGC